MAQRIEIHRPRVKKFDDARQGPARLWPFQQNETVARGRMAFLKNPIIPSRPAAFLNSQRHVRPIETRIQPPARLASLADLKQGGAEPVYISYADIRFRQAKRRDVLAERGSVGHDPVLAPGSIVVAGIVMDGLFRAAMVAGIALIVALQPRGRNGDLATNRLLVYAARHLPGTQRRQLTDEERFNNSNGWLLCKWGISH